MAGPRGTLIARQLGLLGDPLVDQTRLGAEISRFLRKERVAKKIDEAIKICNTNNSLLV